MPQRTFGVKEEEKRAFTEPKKEKEHAKKLRERERLQQEISDIEDKISGGKAPKKSAELEQKKRQLSDLEGSIGDIEAEFTETYTDYTLIEMPPPEVQRHIDQLPSQQRRVIDRILEEKGYDSDEFRGAAQQITTKLPTGESIPLGQVISDISAKEVERLGRLDNLYDQMYEYGDNLLKGKLPDLPQETIDIFTKQVEDAYAPEFAALGLTEERQRNLIKEQGVQALNQINEMRLQAETIFKEEGVTALGKLKEYTAKERTRLQGLRAGVEARREEFIRSNQQRMLDLAAATGRSPMDPQFNREYAQIIGKEFAAQEAELSALEQGIGEQAAEGERSIDELTRTRLLGLSRQILDMERGVGALGRERELGLTKEIDAARGVLSSQRGATRAGQLFSARTSLPGMGFAAQTQASGLFNAQQTQDLANQFSMFTGASGLAAPLLQERLAQPTTTEFLPPISAFGNILGGLGGAAYGAGSIIRSLKK